MDDARFDYELDPWGSTLTVLVCKKFSDLPAQASALGVPDEDDEDFSTYRGVCWSAPFDKPPRKGASVARWVIAIRPKSSANVVAHESTHAALFICAYHGLPVSGDADLQEALAYQVGFVVACVRGAIKQHRSLQRRGT